MSGNTPFALSCNTLGLDQDLRTVDRCASSRYAGTGRLIPLVRIGGDLTLGRRPSISEVVGVTEGSKL